jgi:beta-phosphoglucomutase-like phosphatase (HAD superfamily)
MKNKKIQGVIFDFNGTLLWDTPFHNLAFDIFQNKKGLPPITDEEKKVLIHGKGNQDIMNALFRNVLSESEVIAYTLEKELIYQELCKNDLHLAAGAEDFIEWLRANSIPYCIGSSVGKENVDFYFENMNLGKLKPDAIVTDIMHPSQTQEAFEMLEKEPHKHLKILLDFNL